MEVMDTTTIVLDHTFFLRTNADDALASYGACPRRGRLKIVEAPFRRHVGPVRSHDLLAIRDAFARGSSVHQRCAQRLHMNQNLHKIALAKLNRRTMSVCSEGSAGRQQVVTETATRNTQGPVTR